MLASCIWGMHKALHMSNQERQWAELSRLFSTVIIRQISIYFCALLRPESTYRCIIVSHYTGHPNLVTHVQQYLQMSICDHGNISWRGIQLWSLLLACIQEILKRLGPHIGLREPWLSMSFTRLAVIYFLCWSTLFPGHFTFCTTEEDIQKPNLSWISLFKA